MCVHSLDGWNGSTTALAVWRSGLPTAVGHNQQAMGTQPGSLCISRVCVSCADCSMFPASLVALLLLAGEVGEPTLSACLLACLPSRNVICKGHSSACVGRGAMAVFHAAVTPPRRLGPYVLPIHAHSMSRA